MNVDCIRLVVDERSAQICNMFFDHSNNQYRLFMNIVQRSSVTGESVYDLENVLILQTREAIDFAYKTALSDILKYIDHFDHSMTTQAVKTSHVPYEK